jgi:RNA polymerase sigma factor (sigma-70 family)
MLHSRETSPDDLSPSHEEFFLERYHRLLDLALKLTNQQRAAAEDLVHDAFIQFMLCRSKTIDNLDGYLYGMLRYMHLSQLRRSAQPINKMSLTIADYDSAEGSLASAVREDSYALHSRIQIQDELRQICQYACARKETSKSASVLILRFFLGYFPREISQILRCQDRAVRNLLMTARREVKLYLSAPDRLKLFTGDDAFKVGDGFNALSTGNLLQDLRNTIFRSRRRECLSEKQIQAIYDEAAGNNVLDCATLAHIVSCIGCLEEINRTLKLQPLIERFPTDMLGPDNGPDDSEGGSGSTINRIVTTSRRRLSEVFEHRPQELRVTVNGFLIGSINVSGEITELNLNSKADEPVEFIEVFSERGIRLLFFAPALSTGAGRQRADVELSGGRTLQVEYHPDTQWSSFQIIYCDPELDDAAEATSLGLVEVIKSSEAESSIGNSYSEIEPGFINLRRALAASWRFLFSSRLWLHPGRVTAFIVSLLAIALLIYLRVAPGVDAAGVLARASATEETIDRNPDVIQHRMLDLEERRPADGRVIARRRIEDWQSGERGVRVRRLYDEKNQLIAGEWRKADGKRALFRRKAAPKTSPQPSTQPLSTNGVWDGVWQFDLSAKDFSTLIKNNDAATIEETAQIYVIEYQPSAQRFVLPAAELIRAAITLSKHDLHTVEQTLLIRQANETREFRFVERSYEQLSTSGVPPGAFELEPELVGSSGATERRGDVAIVPHTPTLLPSPPALATAELEVEVIYLLNQVNAFSGDQLSVTRTPEGMLKVEGIIDKDERKQELVRALAPVSNHPAVKIMIETPAEAARRHTQQQSRIIISEVQVPNKLPPAYSELRRHFIERGAPHDQIDHAIEQFADNAMGRSRRAQEHARAMKDIAVRFSPEQLSTLSEGALARWRAMIRGHAQAFQREAAILRRELDSIFPPDTSINFTNETQIETKLNNGADLVRAVEQLSGLWSAVDESVREAFSISLDDPATAPIKLPQFWRSLRKAEQLAEQIQTGIQVRHR